MAFDHFSIRALAAEIGQILNGRTILSAGSAATPGADAGTDAMGFAVEGDSHIIAGLGRRGYLCRAPGEIPVDWACSGAERYLVDAEIVSMVADDRDRTITARLCRPDANGRPSHALLIFELVEPYFQAALISEQTLRVIGLWSRGSSSPSSRRRLVVGRPYEVLPGRQRLRPDLDKCVDFEQRLNEQPDADLRRALCQVLVGVDRWTAEEFAHRAGISPSCRVVEVAQARIGQLWQLAGEAYAASARARLPSVTFVWTESGRTAFSALQPTRQVEDLRSCPSISEAICTWRGTVDASSPDSGRKSSSFRRRALKSKLRRLTHTRLALETDLVQAAEAATCEKMGSVLMANLGSVRRGQERVSLPDTFDATGRVMIQIDLDPLLEPAANAAKFLKLSRKYCRRLSLLPRRLERLKADEKLVIGLMQQLDDGDDPPLAEWEAEPSGSDQGRSPARGGPSRAQAYQAHPRRYLTTSGWAVWAGRNNRENDVLTHELAAPDDVWFHAQGYAGSHVVLRRSGRVDEPSARTLHEAAAVAAYWSKGRTARKVPVLYTRVRYVTKPKGAPAGVAHARREKTLLVEPSLLATEEG